MAPSSVFTPWCFWAQASVSCRPYFGFWGDHWAMLFRVHKEIGHCFSDLGLNVKCQAPLCSSQSIGMILYIYKYTYIHTYTYVCMHDLSGKEEVAKSVSLNISCSDQLACKLARNHSINTCCLFQDQARQIPNSHNSKLS